MKAIHDRHTKGLRALAEEGFVERSIVVCNEPRPRLNKGIEIMPWEYFLKLLWNDDIMPKVLQR